MNLAGELVGRLVLDDRVAAGRVAWHEGTITDIDLDDEATAGAGPHPAGTPVITPGLVDVHVHGWGGHDAMGGPEALDGMARALVRRGVTSFLPTAVTASLDRLATFADDVRGWLPRAPRDGASPLGFNLEGPFLAASRRGAHERTLLRDPETVTDDELDPLLDGLRVMTIAPELPGALDLIASLRARGVVVSLGHSGATFGQAKAGYAAGATSTTHLFNAMTGIDHRAPGLAAAALLEDDAFAELIADGIHVDPALWPLIGRLKPVDRLLLVSDAVAMAGTGDRRGWIGGLEVEVVDGRVSLIGTTTLAGSVLALDRAVSNVVEAGVTLPAAVAAASRNPLALLGIADRGRLAVGQRADLVELDGDLQVRRVVQAGAWLG
jgi:N-acetylglucosamine-6-phosphate deacetylase